MYSNIVKGTRHSPVCRQAGSRQRGAVCLGLKMLKNVYFSYFLFGTRHSLAPAGGSVSNNGLCKAYPNLLKNCVLNGSCIWLSGERKRPCWASYILPFICINPTSVKCSCPVKPRPVRLSAKVSKC